MPGKILMPRHEEQRVLPYRPEFIFDIVADVGAYPEFLPWCIKARVYRKKEDDFFSDVVIGFKMFRETWTSHVFLDKPNKIVSKYVRGPMKRLHNEWTFTPHAEGVLVNFMLDFEFKNPIIQKLIGHLFDEAAYRMVKAFDARAEELSKGTRT